MIINKLYSYQEGKGGGREGGRKEEKRQDNCLFTLAAAQESLSILRPDLKNSSSATRNKELMVYSASL